MNFKNDRNFKELVKTHKACVAMSKKSGNLSGYKAMIQRQMNLEHQLMLDHAIPFSTLHWALMSA